jgi:shikimate kinase
MRIFLIGYRGTGKSTVARLLADKLGLEAIDADHELELRAGKTIRRIFAEDGEKAFRDLESTLLAEFGERDGVVIATGGGVVLRPENRAILRTGRVVWLSAPADVLWRRMCDDESTRERRPDLAQG